MLGLHLKLTRPTPPVDVSTEPAGNTCYKKHQHQLLLLPPCLMDGGSARFHRSHCLHCLHCLHCWPVCVAPQVGSPAAAGQCRYLSGDKTMHDQPYSKTLCSMKKFTHVLIVMLIVFFCLYADSCMHNAGSEKTGRQREKRKTLY